MAGFVFLENKVCEMKPNWHEDFGDEPGIEECFEDMDAYEAQRQVNEQKENETKTQVFLGVQLDQRQGSI